MARAHSAQSDYYTDRFGSDAGTFYAGERMCAPSNQRPGSTMRQALAVVVALVGGGMALKATQETWQPLLSPHARVAADDAQPAPIQAANSQQTPQLETGAQTTAPPPAEAMADGRVADVGAGEETGPPIEVVKVGPPAGAELGQPATEPTSPEARPQSEDAAAEQAASQSPSQPEPLPPPVIDPADKVQTRAIAVGLHPGLSRALLMDLSANDYRNAGRAVRTALTQTPDGDVYVWPSKARHNGAQFEVRFVAGAPHGCRRYVVTIIRNRWSTTAAPLEKCGLNSPAGKQTSEARD